MKVPKIIAKKAGGGYSVAADGKCITARSNAFAKANKYRQKTILRCVGTTLAIAG